MARAVVQICCIQRQILRTTVHIDAALLDAVRVKLGVSTRTEAIEASLREVLEREDRVRRALRHYGAYTDFRLPSQR